MDEKERFGTAPYPIRAKNRSPSLAPVPKVQGSSMGTVVGGALATLLVGILTRNGVTLSEVETGAVMTLVMTLFTFLGGYLTPPQGFGGASDGDNNDAGNTGDGMRGTPGTSYGGGGTHARKEDPASKFRHSGALAIIALIMASLALGGCQSAVNPIASLFGFQAIPVETPNQRMLVLEEYHQAALRSVDRAERDGLIRNQSTRNALATTIEQAGAAMDAANYAVRTGQPNQQALLTTAQLSLNQLILYLRSLKGGS
jgi:hypothetical protein